ncbi:MAG: hypothetical protein IJB47_05340 [Oscillospiraceae bacterium]|nr:hypothetical protein [Oscillospiraceae bacterium]
MDNVLLKSAAFIFLIALGYFLKCKGVFGKQDYKILVRIVTCITMPCAVLISFASYPADFSLLMIVGLGLGMNCLMLLSGFLLSKKYPRRTRAVWLNCVPGYNIGAFAMPFVQSFLSPASLVGTCLFDLGNALMCNGTTFALSKNILDGTKGVNFKRIGQTLLHSVPFLAYVIFLLLTLLQIKIPEQVITFVTPMANANAFLAMMMVGMMLDLRIEKAIFKEVIGMLATRFIGAALASAAFFFLLPLSLPIRQALAVTVFAPVSMVSTAFTPSAGGDPAVAACVNSFSIIICIPCIMTLLAVFGIL